MQCSMTASVIEIHSSPPTPISEMQKHSSFNSSALNHHHKTFAQEVEIHDFLFGERLFAHVDCHCLLCEPSQTWLHYDEHRR